MASSLPSKDKSALSRRGIDLADGPNYRNTLQKIRGDFGWYHPIINPGGVVNMCTSENHRMLDDVAEFIQSKDLALTGIDFNYSEGGWGSLRLREAMAKFLNKYHHPFKLVHAEELHVANGCTSIFNMLGLTLGDAGDGILLSRPTYVGFPGDFSLIAKLQPVYVPFEGIDLFSVAAVDKFDDARKLAAARGIRIRLLMLCNPHNPLGQCYPKETIVALMKFCNNYDIHLLADDVYSQSVYKTSGGGSVPFVSVLSFKSSDFIRPDLLHVQYGMSKDFACGGLRLGVLHTRNKELMRALGAIAHFAWVGSVDERVAITILEDEEWVEGFLETSRLRLSESSMLTRGLIEELGIEYSKASNAGFFFWINLAPWLQEIDGDNEWDRESKLSERLMKSKIPLVRGASQSSEQPGYFRLVFSQPEDTIREGFRRLKKALKGLEHT